MKVTAFIGSGRKRHTWHASELFLQKLQSLGDIEYEMIMLSDYNIGTCKGCRTCFDRGSKCCPYKDDRDLLIEKILNSDGVVFATPNYSFQVSSIMKIFIDRLAFTFHRPRYFGITFTNIVTQGIGKGGDITKYLNFIGKGMGFNVVKGCCIKTLEPMTEASTKKAEKIIDLQSRKFFAQLTKEENPSPSMFWLMAFRMGRTSIQKMLNDTWKDYTFYKENGWFESEYFYPVKLNPVKKIAGKVFDILAYQIIRY